MTEHRFRSDAGQETYDSAKWLVPPAPVRALRLLPSGVSLVVQVGAALDKGLLQEALVGKRREESLLIYPDGTKDVDICYGRQVVQPKAKIGLAHMGAHLSARFVNRPNQKRTVHIIMPSGFRSAVLQDPTPPEFDGRFVGATDALTPLFFQFCADCDDPDAPDMMMDTFVALMIQKLSVAREPAIGNGLAHWQVKRAKEMMADGLGQTVSLLDLARETQLSASHFARAFKRSTGVPPHRYQLRRRLELGGVLLRDTQRSVADIAATVGFEDQSYFARSFRRMHGLSPIKYRAMFKS